MGHPLLLNVPDDIYNLLSHTAEQTNQPLEELAVEWLVRGGRVIKPDPLDKWIGAFDGGMPDWADRHDEFIGQSLMDDHESKDPRSNLDA